MQDLWNLLQVILGGIIGCLLTTGGSVTLELWLDRRGRRRMAWTIRPLTDEELQR